MNTFGVRGIIKLMGLYSERAVALASFGSIVTRVCSQIFGRCLERNWISFAFSRMGMLV